MIDSNFLLRAQKTTEHAIQTQIDSEWVHVQTALGQSILSAATRGMWSCSFVMAHKINGQKATKMLRDIGFNVNESSNRTHPVHLQISWESKNDGSADEV